MTLLLIGCSPGGVLTVAAPPSLEDALQPFVALLEDPRVTLVIDPDAATLLDAQTVVVEDDLDCVDCYELEARDGGLVAHGGGLIGTQTALARVVEALDYRFPHPEHTWIPDELALERLAELDGEEGAPEVARRGLHLHTLHPIEGLFDVWQASSPDRAERIIDWVVKNRGNHLQWVALDDILVDPDRHARWADTSHTIVDLAHARGLTTGVGVQLFGSGNLQLAFDLVEDASDDEAAQRAAVQQRMGLLFEGGDFDLVNLSFGEFLGEDPKTFIATASHAVDEIHALRPEVEVATVIHVGNYDDLRVTYAGEEMLYYFLAQFVPDTTTWVHSVMFYNLYEDAGLAYLHEEFDEHRAFLEAKLSADEAVGYFPETAYWVAFDINVPQYLPLYLRSRWLDLDRIGALGGRPLDAHILFSSGWEWGYWQNDLSALRQSYALPPDPYDTLRDAMGPLGGRGLAEIAAELGELQHRFLLQERLAAYQAGRESVIDGGDALGIVSQPDRPRFSEMAAWSQEERQGWRDDILVDLDAYADELAALVPRAQLTVPAPNAWTQETLDGIEVTAARAAFAAAVFRGAADHADGLDASDDLEDADEALAWGRSVVDRRHAALHHHDAPRLIVREDNASFYDFGYLLRAEELCFWERERAELVVLTGGEADLPSCAFD